MKKLSIIIMGLLVVLAAGLPSQASNQCNTVEVKVGLTLWTIARVESCSYGSYTSLQERYVHLLGSAMAGPECVVVLRKHDKGGPVESSFRISQNWCAAEAGNLSVSHISGPALNPEIHPGSYAQGMPGRVLFLYSAQGGQQGGDAGGGKLAN